MIAFFLLVGIINVAFGYNNEARLNFAIFERADELGEFNPSIVYSWHRACKYW